MEMPAEGRPLPGVEPPLYSHNVIEFGIEMSHMQIIYKLSLFLKGNIILRQVVIDIFLYRMSCLSSIDEDS